MAHLWSCWCGKYYRCDIDHPPRKHIMSFIEEQHEQNCPDFLLHGPRSLKLSFIKLESERFKQDEMLAYKMDLREIIESNSVKEQG